MTATEKYIKDWDKIIQQWAKDGRMSDDDIWSDFRDSLCDILIPEPYWGDPEKCSCVMLNLNPGSCANPDETDTSHWTNRNDSTTVCGLMAQEYSRYAKPFSLLDEKSQQDEAFRDYAGTRWWRNRVKWSNRVLGREETAGVDSDNSLRPFAIELCGWHSQTWSNSNINSKQIKKIQQETDFGEVLSEAILNSESQIGLAVGANYRGLLVKLGFKDITKEFRTSLAEYEFDETKNGGSFHPLQDAKRWYKVYRDEKGATTICTWAIAYTNSEPTPAFAEFEKKLMTAINKNRK